MALQSTGPTNTSSVNRPMEIIFSLEAASILKNYLFNSHLQHNFSRFKTWPKKPTKKKKEAEKRTQRFPQSSIQLFVAVSTVVFLENFFAFGNIIQ